MAMKLNGKFIKLEVHMVGEKLAKLFEMEQLEHISHMYSQSANC